MVGRGRGALQSPAVFQIAEVAVPRHLFLRILNIVDDLRPREPTSC